MQAQQNNVPILMYHSISNCTNSKFRQFTVTPMSFAEQMRYLFQHNYTPITVTQLIKARYQAASLLPAHPIVITFDDGFADFFTSALPILKQYNFAATLYISTAFIDGASRWLRHERETTRPMLTWKQLIEISTNNTIECGAHSHSHPQLDTLPLKEAQNEILQSKRILEDHLGQKVYSFAYPFGYYTDRVRRLVQEAEYTSACAVRHKISSETDDPFSLARLMIRTDSYIEDVEALLTSCSSSPVTAAYQIYVRTRTPAWQLARRCSASIKRYLYQRRSAS